MKTPPIYGLDFLTTCESGTFDPQRDRIAAIGLATSAGTEIYDGDEADLLDLVDRRLGLLPTGVIATWFGSLIGLPLLQARADSLNVVLQLNIAPDRRSKVDSSVVELDQAVMANWRSHQHIDLRKAYTDKGGRRRLVGRRDNDAPTSDTQISGSSELAMRDPEQNARLIRQMTERRWPQCRRLVDRVPVAANPWGNQQESEGTRSNDARSNDARSNDSSVTTR